MDHMHLSDFYSEGKERKIRIAVKKREYKNATLNIDGYKHSMVQIIALAVALKIKIVINNPPLVSDTLVFIEIINHLGGHAELNDGKLYINAQSINKYSIPEFLGRCIHGSLYLCPALLTAIGYFEYFGSGGCQIGNSEDLNERPINHVLSVISKFGHEVIFKEDKILGIRKSVDNLSSIDIMEYSTSQDGLSGPLVGGATKVALLMSVYQDSFEIVNPYLKTDVWDMISFLKAIGKKIYVSKDKIICCGEVLLPQEHYIDFSLTQCISEIMTYSTLAAICNTTITFKSLNKKTIAHTFSPELTLMEAMGITIRWDEDDLIVYSKKNLKSIDIEVNPMTIQSDHHPFFVLLLLNADRRSVLVEKVWKDRFMYVDNLSKLGASISISGNSITINPSVFHSFSGDLPALDVRSAAVTLLAIILSNATSSLVDCAHIFRGYSRLKEHMNQIGVGLEFHTE